MAASSCSAAAAAAAATVWFRNGAGGSEKKSVLASATATQRYDVLRSSTIRSCPFRSVSSRCPLSRQTWKRSGRPVAVGMESSRTTEATKTKAKAKTKKEKKIAKLYVEKRQTVPLPTFADASGNPQHLRVFLGEPEGMKCMLNTKVLRKYEDVGDGVFKCYLPMMEFLKFEVAPVIELQVDAREESCQVDLLSCKFEGSDLIRGQNERFSASMRNHLTWSRSSTEQEDGEECLHVRVELNVALEVYTLPFTLLPISAVETPGKMVLQALVDRLIPVFVEQLFIDYKTWAQAQNSSAVGDDSPGVQEQMEVNGSARA